MFEVGVFGGDGSERVVVEWSLSWVLADDLGV